MGLTTNITGPSEALDTQQYGSLETTLPVFGGEGVGLANDVAMLAARQFYANTAEGDAMSIPVGQEGKQIPRAIFNKYALFNYKGMHWGLDSDPGAQGQYRDTIEGGVQQIQGGQQARHVTANKIITFFQERYPHIGYQPSDFLYHKYYKKIPINHMITLRRFGNPCFDNIYDLKVRPKGQDKGGVEAHTPAGVTAVTYLGETAGNPMAELLKYNFGFNWKKLKSEMEKLSSGDKGYTSQPFYNKIGGIGRAAADTFKGVNAGEKFRKSNFSVDDALGTTYANFVLGPINVVDETYIRETGLTMTNELKLNFEYSAKALSFVNPKIAMLDIMVNMMTMTYNNAQFYGGGHRFYGSGGYVASQFGDINKLKNGDFAGYVGSVVNDIESGFKSAFGDSSGGFSLDSILEGGLKVGKNMLGNMLGSFLGGQVGGASGSVATKAFISAEPTGDWHVTIGNPLNPINMMGNMICDNTVMTLGEGLGPDDFPTEVKFEVNLKHGKPRDKGDMENMFNMGRGKIYASAKGEKDILNLAGLDVDVYGSIQNIGKQSLEGTQSGGSGRGTPTGFAAKDVNTSKAAGQKKIAAETGLHGDYVSNMISMMIDS